MILGCADSRVPPEVVFDQGLGDLFVVRVAGNIVDDVVLASLEYGAGHLESPLLMVLGHSHCGAVAATLEEGELEGHLNRLAEAIRPAALRAREHPGDPLERAVRINVEMTAECLRTSEPVLSERIRAGKLKVVGACYHLDSGEVELMA
jgi:carbonic anhydrase